MGTNKATPWVAGAVVAILVVLAGGWFLAISPAMANADESRAQAVTERDHNVLLKQQIAILEGQFAHLDEYKAQLAEFRVQLPPQADLSPLNTELQALGANAGLTTTSFGATTAQAFVPAVTVPTPAATVTAAGAAAATDAPVTAAGSTASAPPAAFAGFYAVPVSMTVLGTYDATLTFLDSLQTTTKRLFLVGSVTATSQQNQGATIGKPATSAGDLETVITGFAYVLQEAATAATEPVATPAPLPVPSDQKNPFVPVH